MNKEPHSLIIGVDFSRGDDVGVLIVGKQVNGKIEIVNAYQGQKAIDIYNQLVSVHHPKGDTTDGM